ncbi:MAG: ribosomal protein S18-alanine N-acetyltransferase [Microthrixaceae bacterium]
MIGLSIHDRVPSGEGSAAPQVCVVPMRRRHLRGVMAIEQRTNPHPWSLGLFMGELRMPTSRYYVVALHGHEVVGYCGLMDTAGEGHITNVAVHPDRRRTSIATRMMSTTMRHAVTTGLEGVTLEVRMSNRGAQELYRRFGFVPGGVRRNYYREVNEDALIMWAHDLDGDAYGRRLDEIDGDLAGRDSKCR